MDDSPDIPPEAGSRAISASWVFKVLRQRLGCVDIGWRDETSWCWVTPTGVEFEVADPAAGATGGGPAGTPLRELHFSRDYARELIGRIRDLLKR